LPKEDATSRPYSAFGGTWGKKQTAGGVNGGALSPGVETYIISHFQVKKTILNGLRYGEGLCCFLFEAGGGGGFFTGELSWLYNILHGAQGLVGRLNEFFRDGECGAVRLSVSPDVSGRIGSWEAVLLGRAVPSPVPFGNTREQA